MLVLTDGSSCCWLTGPPKAWPLALQTTLYALLIFTVSCLLCFFPRPLAALWRIPSYRGESLRGKSNFTSGAWSPRCSLWLASCSQQSHLISPLYFRLPSQVPIHSRAHSILAPRQIILEEMTGGSYHASSGWHAVDMCPSDVPRLIAIATVTLRRDEPVSSLLVLLAFSKYGVKPRKMLRERAWQRAIRAATCRARYQRLADLRSRRSQARLLGKLRIFRSLPVCYLA